MLGRNADLLIWDKFKKGDKSSFSEIYQIYAPTLINYGYKVTSDVALIEDSIQDLFVELWRSREKLSKTDSIKFYLFKALRLKIYRNLSANGSGKMNSLDGHMTLLKSGSQEDFLIQVEGDLFKSRILKDVLQKLPLRQQEAINLRYFHSFSNEEIAAIMGISYNSACKTIYAGLKSLKENLKMAFV